MSDEESKDRGHGERRSSQRIPVEMWVEGEYRLHDRARWTRTLTPLAGGVFQGSAWHHTRLQP